MKTVLLTMIATAQAAGTMIMNDAPACTKAQLNHSTGLHNFTLVVQKRQRRFLLYVPKFYPAESALSLWILAPGAYNEPEKQIQMSEMVQRAEEQQFAFVALRGEDNLMNVVRHGRALPERPDDVEYTRAVIEEMRMILCIDPRRIYCTGYSRGARFCMLLASELPDYVAAVAPVGGIRYPDPNNATRPVPIIAFHGTNDPVNPFNGKGNPEYWYDSVPEAVSKWVIFNGCNRVDSRRITPSVAIERHWNCIADANVVLIKILGGGHTWPGSKYDWDPALGNVTYEISASEVMGQFFSVHPMTKESPQLVNGAFSLLKRQMQDVVHANDIVQQPGPLDRAASRKRRFR